MLLRDESSVYNIMCCNARAYDADEKRQRVVLNNIPGLGWGVGAGMKGNIRLKRKEKLNVSYVIACEKYRE